MLWLLTSSHLQMLIYIGNNSLRVNFKWAVSFIEVLSLILNIIYFVTFLHTIYWPISIDIYIFIENLLFIYVFTLIIKISSF